MKLFICHPRCSSCDKARKKLQELNIPFEERDITSDAPTSKEISKWYQDSGLAIGKVFNTSGMKYRELGLSQKRKEMSEEEQLELLASDGMLVKRPILVAEDGQVLFGYREADYENIK